MEISQPDLSQTWVRTGYEINTTVEIKVANEEKLPSSSLVQKE